MKAEYINSEFVKSCPKCGCEAIMKVVPRTHENSDNNEVFFYMYCDNTSCDYSTSSSEFPQFAIANWNNDIGGSLD